MSARRVIPVMTALSLGISCSSADERPARSGGSAGVQPSGGAAGSLGKAGVGGTLGSDGGAGTSGAGAGGSAGKGGAAGAGGVAQCGDGVRAASEICEGSDFGRYSCKTYGFDDGTLVCANCMIDHSACSGDENCTDGADNDGDGEADCADSDCLAACAASCPPVEVLDDPGFVEGETSNHASQLKPACSGAQSGPEIVYAFTATKTGVVEANLLASASANFNLSIRTACASGTELGCSERTGARDSAEHLVVPAAQGVNLFVVVDGTGSGVAGGFRLDVKSRAVVCGDGNRDANESCDDGNNSSTDGCSSTCVLEPDESEPNDSVAQSYSGSPFFGAISPATDVDLFSISVTSAGSKITAEVFDLGDGACAKGLLDSNLAILATNGTTVLATNDDYPTRVYCSLASASNLTPGTYYVRLTSSGTKPSFPYNLNVSVTP